MHEFGFAQQILFLAQETARLNGISKISKIKVILGEQLNIMPEALEFALCVLGKGTMAETAAMLIEHRKAKIQCDTCAIRYYWAEYGYRCPECGSRDIRIVEGTEIIMEYLEGE